MARLTAGRLATRAQRYRARAAELAETDPDLAAGHVTEAEKLEARLIQIGRCCRCGRPISDPDSKLRGYGPDCWALLEMERTAS